MRLIKLKIRNIASLRGEHVVEFSDIQRESSLFAITGETGSGKSTILNSIGLVLYGKVYKTNINQNDLVTLGEKEGSIELIFQASGRLFYASWKVKTRKQNGEFYSTPQVPIRELYQIESTDFGGNKIILNEKAENILQLDFDQFCKCIILNQGEFARFLTASFSERKEILEKLYPGELIDSLSLILKKEKDDIEKDIREIDIELHTLKGPDDEGFNFKNNIEKLKKDSAATDLCLETIEKLSFHYTTIVSYQKKYSENEIKVTYLKNALSKETTFLNQTKATQTLVQAELNALNESFEKRRPELQSLLKDEERLKIIQEDIHKTNKLISNSKNDLNKLIDQRDAESSKYKKELEGLDTLRNNLNHPLKELRKIDLVDLFDEWTKHTNLKNQSKTTIEEIEKQKNLQEVRRIRIQELEAESQNLQSTKEKISKLKLQEAVLQQNLNHNLAANQNLKGLKEKLDQAEQSLKQTATELKVKKIAYQEQQDKFKTLQKDLNLATLMSAVEICINHSVMTQDESCPVCHSIIDKDSILRIKNELSIQDKKDLLENEKKLRLELAISEKDLLELATKTKKLETDINENQREIKFATDSILINLPSLDTIRLEIDETQKILWLGEKSSSELILFKEEFKTLQESILHQEKKLSEISYPLRTSTDKINKINQDHEFIKGLSDSTINSLKEDERALRKINESEFIIEKTEQTLAHRDETIKKLGDSLSGFINRSSELELTHSELRTFIKSKLGEKSAGNIIDEMTTALKIKSDLLSQRDQELKNQELKIKELQSRLFTIDELLRDIDLLFAKAVHIIRDLAHHHDTRQNTELDTLIQRLSHLDLKLTDPEELFIPLLDRLEIQKTIYKQKSSEIKMELASFQTRLEAWERKQDRIKILELKSNDLEIKHQRKLRLFEVLGKDELRTFVLSMVEENLIIHTNEELQKLCQGRYEIIHFSRANKLAPEFFIMDKFRDGGIRKISTLSGGETFMVSLAMAIALAEMTRGKAEIDSLFIDEGFGTLDSDSLQDVLDVLKQIQTRGLMIGIISHVKELTNSIPINLNVVKGQDGSSSLRLVFN
jgi:exonuclease SbcC